MMNEKSISMKYRPNKLSECVLPKRISKRLDKWKDKTSNHLIFYGSAGIGKTSTARALANEKYTWEAVLSIVRDSIEE